MLLLGAPLLLLSLSIPSIALPVPSPKEAAAKAKNGTKVKSKPATKPAKAEDDDDEKADDEADVEGSVKVMKYIDNYLLLIILQPADDVWFQSLKDPAEMKQMITEVNKMNQGFAKVRHL